MFVAHLPAGYLLATALWPKVTADDDVNFERVGIGVALAASVAPDIGLFYFYFVDDRSTHHHHYFPHLPAVWIVAGLALWTFFALSNRPRAKALVVIGTVSGLVHLALDTVVGHIKWGWPVSNSMLAAFDVPARFDHWILNFVLHWSFGFELAIGVVAASVYYRRGATRRPTARVELR